MDGEILHSSILCKFTGPRGSERMDFLWPLLECFGGSILFWVAVYFVLHHVTLNYNRTVQQLRRSSDKRVLLPATLDLWDLGDLVFCAVSWFAFSESQSHSNWLQDDAILQHCAKSSTGATAEVSPDCGVLSPGDDKSLSWTLLGLSSVDETICFLFSYHIVACLACLALNPPGSAQEKRYLAPRCLALIPT